MARYRVDWQNSGFFYIEAESQDEAESRAWDEAWQHDGDRLYISVEED